LLAAMKRSRSSRGAVLTGAGLGSTKAQMIFDRTVPIPATTNSFPLSSDGRVCSVLVNTSFNVRSEPIV
jgi:hypothetical protein